MKSSYNVDDFDSSSSSVNYSKNVHHLGAGPNEGIKYAPIFSYSYGENIIPDPSLHISISFISAFGSIFVNRDPSSMFHIFIILRSHVINLLESEFILIYLIGNL